MLEHPLLVAFAKLVADFIGIPGNDPELLKSVFARCAQALLEGQDPATMRDTFEFERIQHFTTQYLTKEDRDGLNDLLGSVGMGLVPGQKKLSALLSGNAQPGNVVAQQHSQLGFFRGTDRNGGFLSEQRRAAVLDRFIPNCPGYQKRSMDGWVKPAHLLPGAK